MEDSKDMQTIPKIETLVFANIEDPSKHTRRFKKFKHDPYKNLHQAPSFRAKLELPPTR